MLCCVPLPQEPPLPLMPAPLLLEGSANSDATQLLDQLHRVLLQAAHPLPQHGSQPSPSPQPRAAMPAPPLLQPQASSAPLPALPPLLLPSDSSGRDSRASGGGGGAAVRPELLQPSGSRRHSMSVEMLQQRLPRGAKLEDVRLGEGGLYAVVYLLLDQVGAHQWAARQWAGGQGGGGRSQQVVCSQQKERGAVPGMRALLY